MVFRYSKHEVRAILHVKARDESDAKVEARDWLLDQGFDADRSFWGVFTKHGWRYEVTPWEPDNHFAEVAKPIGGMGPREWLVIADRM